MKAELISRKEPDVLITGTYNNVYKGRKSQNPIIQDQLNSILMMEYYRVNKNSLCRCTFIPMRIYLQNISK